VARFDEVFACSPATRISLRNEPTLIEFWNPHPDDDHDFLLMDPRWAVMLKALLPARLKTSDVFTFHQDGSSSFTCAMHQPAMNGQIPVGPLVGR
jgi:hypothetical protein